MSLATLWAGIGLSFTVGVVAFRIMSSTYDAGAALKEEEKQKRKKAKLALANDPPAPPFGSTRGV